MTPEISSHARPKAVPVDWDGLREGLKWNRRVAPSEDLRLSGPTAQWLSTLPTGARPLHLPLRFARIANGICAGWNDPITLRRLFFRVLHDNRGNRSGFPPLVREELTALQSYAAKTGHQ